MSTGLRTQDISSLTAASLHAAQAAAQGTAPSANARRALEKLAAVVLLGGSVRTSRFGDVIGRSVLDLPVEKGCSLLEYWHAETIRLARHLELRRLQIRVMVDRDATEPRAPHGHEHAVLSVERDPLEYRGTGGVLKDLSGGYADDDFLLVGNAAQVLLEPLSGLVECLAERGADVNVIAHRDGTPSGLMLVKCSALRGIPEAGFVDMKEQALPAIAKSGRVEVVERERASGAPVRNLSDYISALRRRGTHNVISSSFAEDWQTAFSIVEEGALVAPNARVHDSVVLKGAIVENGAVVVRSLIGPGAVVNRGEMAAEQLRGYSSGNYGPASSKRQEASRR